MGLFHLNGLYMTACDLEMSLIFEKSVEITTYKQITSHVRYPIDV